MAGTISLPSLPSTASLRALSLEHRSRSGWRVAGFLTASHHQFPSGDHEPGRSGRFVPPRCADAGATPESCHCARLPARRPSKWLFLLSIGATLLCVASCTSLKTGSFPDSLVVSPTSASGSDTLLEVVRSSLDSESWQRNHIWTAKAEWDHRRRGFPLAQDLRWRFAKNWDPARENAESPSAVDVPVEEKQRPEQATSKTSTGDAKKSATKTPATDPKKDSPGDSTADEGRSTKDAQAEPEQAPQWDGLWPLTIADILHPADKSSKDSSGAVSPAMDEGVRCLRRLARSNNPVGWNAAILWAQQDPISAVEVADRLQKLIVNPPQYVAETGDGPTNTENDLSNRFKRGRQNSRLTRRTSPAHRTLPAGKSRRQCPQPRVVRRLRRGASFWR